MENCHNNSDYSLESDSKYLTSSSTGQSSSVGYSLISNTFQEISPLYISNTGFMQIYEGIRYGKRYVLKCLKSEVKDDPIWTIALTKEFELGIKLDHPNIRSTIGFEEIDKLGKVIILEYIDGVTLKSLIDSKNISKHSARHIALQLAKSLEYLHSKQIIHRDLKPSNILISHTGNVVKLIDFNLADSDTFTILKGTAGTPRYMAPELHDSNVKPNVKTDIYSFGIIVKELAEISHDNELLETANICCDDNSDNRPSSISEIKIELLPQNKRPDKILSLSSNRLTPILISAIILLLFLGVAIYIFKYSNYINEQSVINTNAVTDEIEVIEMQEKQF